MTKQGFIGEIVASCGAAIWCLQQKQIVRDCKYKPRENNVSPAAKSWLLATAARTKRLLQMQQQQKNKQQQGRFCKISQLINN